MEDKNKEKIKGINWYATFIFNNLTKYGWCVSGGKVTRAKMFYDMQKNSPGFITRYDFIAFDEKPLNFLTTKR